MARGATDPNVRRGAAAEPRHQSMRCGI